MIDTEALRKKVIDLAIQGKLTEQLPTDGDAETLYAQIQEEKARLVKEGKIKKDKPLPEITDDEIPFEIPENWKWARFSTIITLQSGQDLNSTDYNDDENGIPYITGASNYLDDGTLIINRWTDSPKAFAYRGDILLSCKGTVGKLTILEEKEVHIARQIMGIRTYSVNVSFIRYFVDCMLERIKSASKGLIPGIERNDILNLCCPLPSVEEQQRIVTKIESVLAEIDVIDDLQEKYRYDLATLKSKIIDAGIRGKLTEQLSDDGDAESLYAQIQEEKAKLIKEGKIKKEKPLPDITEEEIPFEIPKNWKWIRWGDLSEKIQYGYNAPAKSSGRIRMVRISDIQGGKVQWDSVPFCDIDEDNIEDYLLHENDILFARTGGTVGKSYIVSEIPEDAVFAGYLIRTSYSSDIYAPYMKYFMESALYWKQLQSGTIATAQPNCNGKTLAKMIVPFPPYAEQRRIAEKIDNVLYVLTQ